MTKNGKKMRKKRMRMNLRNYLVVFGGQLLCVLASDQLLNKNILHKKNKNVPTHAIIAVVFHGHLNHLKTKMEIISLIVINLNEGDS